MGTSDDSFRAEGPGLFGFLTDSDERQRSGQGLRFRRVCLECGRASA